MFQTFDGIFLPVVICETICPDVCSLIPSVSFIEYEIQKNDRIQHEPLGIIVEHKEKVAVVALNYVPLLFSGKVDLRV